MLTVIQAHRALQNPDIFTNDHYWQAASAVLVGIAIRLLVSLPVRHRARRRACQPIIMANDLLRRL
jgi:hypothetical protein